MEASNIEEAEKHNSISSFFNLQNLHLDFVPSVNFFYYQDISFGVYQITIQKENVESKIQTKPRGTQENLIEDPMLDFDQMSTLNQEPQLHQESDLSVKEYTVIDETADQNLPPEENVSISECYEKNDNENGCVIENTEVLDVFRKNLSVEDFKQMYFHLDLENLLEVEYLEDENNDWRLMLETREGEIFCNLCQCTMSANIPTVGAHLRGENRSNIVKDISALYHPTYCDFSDEESEDYERAASLFYRTCALSEDMTIEEFKEKYTDMDMYNLLDILFLKDTESWTNMFEEKDYLYICNLCDKMELANFYEVQNHIRAWHHKKRVNMLAGLYHPMYLKNSINNVEALEDRKLDAIFKLRLTIDDFDQQEEETELIQTNDDNKEDTNISNIACKIQANSQLKLGTLNELKTEYRRFNIGNLLKIQYSLDNTKKMHMIGFDGIRYSCHLCNNVHVGNVSNVMTHIKGYGHMERVKKIVTMFDPRNSKWIKDDKIEMEKKAMETISSRHLIDASRDSSNGKEKPPSFELFKTEYRKLNLENLLKVQYRKNVNQNHFMIEKRGFQYFCNLCNKAYLGSEYNVVTHIRGIRHSAYIKDVVDMYDPRSCMWLNNGRTASSELKSVCAKVSGQTIATANKSNTTRKRTGKKILNMDAFRLEYINFNFDELLRVEYQMWIGRWKLMFPKRKNLYYCDLCNVMLMPTKNITAHIKGQTHSEKVSNLALQHPDYFLVSDIKEEMKQNYVYLPIDHLLRIEYLNNDGEWKYMLIERNKRYCCNLCGRVNIDSRTNLTSHIRGRIHSDNVSRLVNIDFQIAKKEETDNEEISSEAYSGDLDLLIEAFKKNYVHMKLDLLVGVKYRKNAVDYEYMFDKKDDHYFCNLCHKVLQPANVKEHIRDRVHSKYVSQLEDVYHPYYNPFTDDESSENDEEMTEIDTDWNPNNVEIKRNYVNLPIDHLLRIKYLNNDGEWEYMLIERNKRYCCNLCGRVNIDTIINLTSHIRGKIHSDNVSRLVNMDFQIAKKEETDNEEISFEAYSGDLDLMTEAFKKNYVHMKLDLLVGVKYRKNAVDYEYMFDKKDDHYFCNLCHKVLQPANVKEHIRDRVHSKYVSQLEDVYHPYYNPFTDDENSENDEEITEIDTDWNPNNVEFMANYHKMKIDELLKIEYQKYNDNWEKMLSIKKKCYYCNLCGKVQLGNEYNVTTHIRGQSHSEKVKPLTYLYHPKYCSSAKDLDYPYDFLLIPDEPNDNSDEFFFNK